MSDTINITVDETGEPVSIAVTNTPENITVAVTEADEIVTVNVYETSTLGYVPENAANRVAAFQTLVDDTHYPSEKLVKDSIEIICTQIRDRNSSGWVSGGAFSLSVDMLTITVAAGVGEAFDGSHFKAVAWAEQTNVVHQYTEYNFVSIRYDGTLSITSTEQTTDEYIRLGKFWWDAGAGFITAVFFIPLVVGKYQRRLDAFVGTAIGATVDGLTVSEKSAPNQRQLTFSAGTMHVRLSDYVLTQTSRFVKIYQCSDLYITRDLINDDNTVNTTLWADKTKPAATALTTMTTGYWAKALIVVNITGLYYFVYPEAEYATEDLAKAAPLPFVNVLLADDNACVCMIVYQKGDTSIASRIHDIRPNFQRIFGTQLFAASGATVAHNALLNLSYATSGHTGFVPDTRTVNGHPLSSNVTVTKDDLSLQNLMIAPHERVFRSPLATASYISPATRTGYFAYLGRTLNELRPRYCELYLSALGESERCEVGIFATDFAPNKSDQRLGKIDARSIKLDTLGVLRNTESFENRVPTDVHLWVGFRGDIITTMRLSGLTRDFSEGYLLFLGDCPLFTDVDRIDARIIPATDAREAVDLRLTLD